MRRSLTCFCNTILTTVGLGAILVSFTTAPADAIIYTGAPDLPLLSATVAAGGGPQHFSSLTLLKALAGPAAGEETRKLTTQFGKREVETSLAVFDFAVADALRVATAEHITLPKPNPSPSDARQLALALYQAGLTGNGHWDVGYMLEHAMSHPIHHVIMTDMDAKFGAENNGRFHVVLAQMMDDLSMAYAQSK